MAASPPAPTRRRRILGIGAAAFILLVLLGPRPAVEVPTDPIQLPLDLERHLAEAEARVPDLKAETEKTIIWADPLNKTRTPLALVYLHGFSATRQETRPLCDEVAKALGANLYYTRLTGHGGTGPALGSATVRDWLQDGREALAIARRLGQRVVMVGMSTGAALATWLASQDEGQDLAGLILISPNFGVARPGAQLLTKPWGGLFVRLVAGAEVGFTPRTPLQAKFWTTRYPSQALLPMMALVELAVAQDWGRIRCPLRVIYSASDQVIDPRRIEEYFPRFGSASKQLQPFEASADHHILAGDALSPGSTAALGASLIEFIRRAD